MKSAPEKGKTKFALALPDKPLDELTVDEQKQFLHAVKKSVFKQEQDNQTHIFLYYTGGGWYKAGGNSALFIYYLIAPTIKDFCPRLRPDSDFQDKFITGTLSFRDLGKIGDIITQFGASYDKVLSQGNFIFAYQVREPVTTAQLRKLLGDEDMKRSELNDTLSLAQADPALSALIRKLQKSTLATVHAMKSIDRDIVGGHLIEANLQLLSAYRSWANGAVDNYAGLQSMLGALDKITDYMLMILENDIITVDKVADFTFQIESIRAAVKKRLSFLDKVVVD